MTPKDLKPKGKKFIVVGDFITSKNDGDRHFVSAEKLVRLYGLNPQECILKDQRHYPYGFKGLESDGIIVLYPRYDGNYEVKP